MFLFASLDHDLFFHFFSKLIAALRDKLFPLSEVFQFLEAFSRSVVEDSILLLLQQPKDIEKRSLTFPVPNHQADRRVFGHSHDLSWRKNRKF